MNKKTLSKHIATTTVNAILPAKRRQVGISTPQISVTIPDSKPRPHMFKLNSHPLLVPKATLVLVVLFPWLALPGFTIKFANFLNIFLGLTIEVLPYLLSGAICGAGLAVWLHGSGLIRLFDTKSGKSWPLSPATEIWQVAKKVGNRSPDLSF